MSSHPRLCPHFHCAIELIGRRWTGAIIFVLLQRPARFAGIRAAIPDITDRMLSERLRELEQEGIVDRVARPEAQPRVEYALTEKGHALARAVGAIAAWSHEWVPADGECPPDCAPCAADGSTPSHPR
jgi:DNA-binding HxlR family transcriptional regulator